MRWLAPAAAVIAAAGAFLIYTSVVFPGTADGDRPRRRRRDPRRMVRLWLDQAGLAAVSTGELLGAIGGVALAGFVGGWLLFGAAVPAFFSGLLAVGLPLSAYRARRHSRREAAAEAWPRLLEEVRLRTGSLGRSIPQALFDAGRHAPEEWRPAFDAAEREWLLTTDFQLTTELLKAQLQDATVDSVCETLCVAYDMGGTDLDDRLAALIEDRRQDLAHRRDAAARAAGVRFARRFVLVVPLGMSLAGLAIGNGRAAYTTAGGQAAVVVALMAVALCWWWSGRLMRLPSPPRVFR